MESMVGVSSDFLVIFNCLRERKGERGGRGRGKREEEERKKGRNGTAFSQSLKGNQLQPTNAVWILSRNRYS